MCCFLNDEFLSYIRRIPTPNSLAGPDGVISSWAFNRKFSVKAVYGMLMKNSLNPSEVKWKLSWSLNVPQRVRHFIWLVFKGRLFTNAKRCRRVLSEDHSCKLCGSVEESCLHVLRDCCKAKEVWKQLVLSRILVCFLSYSLEDWLSANLKICT